MLRAQTDKNRQRINIRVLTFTPHARERKAGIEPTTRPWIGLFLLLFATYQTLKTDSI